MPARLHVNIQFRLLRCRAMPRLMYPYLVSLHTPTGIAKTAVATLVSVDLTLWYRLKD